MRQGHFVEANRKRTRNAEYALYDYHMDLVDALILDGTYDEMIGCFLQSEEGKEKAQHEVSTT